MTREEKQTVLHCLKSMIDEAACEECPLYGMTGTDHCEKDCVRLAINALEQEPCTDAISREDALQALCKAVHKNDDTIPCLNQRVSCLWDKTKVQDYAEEILKLPPVKPQYTDAEIQKMQDLESAEIQKAYEIGKEEGSSEKPNKWIPVSERLPEVGSEVLVCYDFKGKRSVYIADFYGDGKFHGLDDEYLTTEGRKYRKAVAWMPLPTPYKTSPTGEEGGDKE